MFRNHNALRNHSTEFDKSVFESWNISNIWEQP